MAAKRVGVGAAGLTSESRVSRFLYDVRSGVFGTLYVLQRKTVSHSARTLFLLCITLMQMFHFVVSEQAGFVWREGSVGTVRNIIAFAVPANYYNALVDGPQAAIIAYYCAVTWTSMFVLLFAWASVSFAHKTFAAMWPLHVLRIVGKLSTGVLFIPLLTLLLSGFSCNSSQASVNLWTASGIDCSSPGYIVQNIVVALLLVMLFALCSLFTLVFYEPDPLSPALDAKAHGRVDFGFLIIRTLLVVFVDMFRVLPSSPWFNVAVVSFAGLAWLGLYTLFLPHYHATLNRLHIVASTCFCWSVACLALSIGDSGTDAAVQLYMGLPFAAFTGLLLHNSRVAQVERGRPENFASPYTVELRARFTVHAALYGHPTDRLHPLNDEAGAEGGAAAPHTAIGSSGTLASSAIAGGASAGGATAGGAMVATGSRPTTLRRSASRKDSRDAGNDDAERGAASPLSVAAAQRPASAMATGAATGAASSGSAAVSSGWGLSLTGEDDADDREQRAVLVRRLLPPSVVAEVHELYRAAVAKFRASSILHVFYSRFYLSLAGNRHMAMSHLLQAERRRPTLDVSFLAFQARKSAEEASDDGSQLSALARVTFDKYSADAQLHVAAAGKRQLAFFTELLGAHPDLSRLHRLTSEMNASVSSAEGAFAELFALNGQSLAAINLYAAFQQHVLCNVEKAFILAGEAERLNEARSKDYRGEGALASALLSVSPLDVLGDATAVLTVSCAQRSYGLIVSANAATSRLFGFVKMQLERRSFFTLLPVPLNAMFERVMVHYSQTGEGDLGATRVALGLHRSSHSFYVLLSIREAPPTDAPPTFIVLMRALNVAEDRHVLLTQDFYVASLSATVVAQLGLDAQEVASQGDVHLSSLLEGDWERDILPALLSRKSTPLTFLPPSAAAVRAGSDSEYEGDSVGSSADSMGGRGSDGGGGGRGGSRSMHSSVRREGAAQLEFAPPPTSTRVYGVLETASFPGQAPVHLLRLQSLGTRGVLTTQGASATSARMPAHASLPSSSASEVLGVTASARATPRSVGVPPLATRGGLQAAVTSPRTLRKGGAGGTVRELLPGAADELLFGVEGGGRESSGSSHPSAQHTADALLRAASMEDDARTSTEDDERTVSEANAAAAAALVSPRARSSGSGSAGSSSKRSKRDDGERSHASSRASSSRRTTLRLRRLLSDPNPRLLGGLRLLRIVGIAVTVLALGLAAGIAVSTQAAFNA